MPLPGEHVLYYFTPEVWDYLRKKRPDAIRVLMDHEVRSCIIVAFNGTRLVAGFPGISPDASDEFDVSSAVDFAVIIFDCILP